MQLLNASWVRRKSPPGLCWGSVTAPLCGRPQNAVVLDPYARAVVGRGRFGELGPVRHFRVPPPPPPAPFLLIRKAASL